MLLWAIYELFVYIMHYEDPAFFIRAMSILMNDMNQLSPNKPRQCLWNYMTRYFQLHISKTFYIVK